MAESTNTGNANFAGTLPKSKSLVCFSTTSTSDWILDSGASDHMCSSKSMFSTISPLNQPITISLPNGDILSISFAGTVQITPEIILTNVLYVPNFKYNLLSIHRLTQQLNCTVNFTSTTCFLQGHSLRKPLALGDSQKGLYILSSVNNTVNQSCFSSVASNTSLSLNKNVSALTWHSRLGHLPVSKLKTLCNIDSSCIDTLSVCDVCAKARQHRLPFPHSTIHTTRKFELVHVDLWGPYSVCTYNKCKYFITIVDDFTRTTWTHLLSCKSNAFPFLKQFIALVHTQFQATVQIIRTDNALDLGLSKDAQQFFSTNGIIHQTSCSYTPQQNGVVERKHKHLLETSRALLFQSHLPLKFWGDCVLTSTHLINRFPSKLLHGASPYELLFDSKPDYTTLKTFGCLAYVSIPKPHRDKLSPRAHPCVFLGYPYGKKAYKFLCLENHSIIISRDAVFHESVFPYISPDPSHFIPLSLPDLVSYSSSFSNPDMSNSTPSLSPTPPSFTTPNSPPISPLPDPPLRKSTRVSKVPTYLTDYVHPFSSCSTTSLCSATSCFCTLTSLCTADSSNNHTFCSSTSVIHDGNSVLKPPVEPSSYSVAIQHPVATCHSS